MNRSAKEGRVCAGGGPRGDLAEERVTSRYNLAKNDSRPARRSDLGRWIMLPCLAARPHDIWARWR
jgi:hypothetical protein